MAVTTEKSTQLTSIEATPPTMLDTRDNHGRLRYARFTFTQGAAAGDIASYQRLVKLPAGKVRVILELSKIRTSAFGAARTLDFGWEAYTKNGAAVAKSDAGLDAAQDVSAAIGYAPVGTILLDETKEFDSDTGVVLCTKVAGGTIPAAATISGHVAYVVD